MGKRRFLLIMPFILLLLITVVAVVKGRVNYVEEQNKLIASVEEYLEDELYVRCIPAYEKACSYDTEQTPELEKQLLEIYWAYGDIDSYYELIASRIDKETAEVDEYIAIADYFISDNEYTEGMDIIRKGIKLYDDKDLRDYYEEHHYEYIYISGRYNDMLATEGGLIPVRNGEEWGYLSSSGKLITGMIYEELTPFSGEYAIAKIDGTYYCINNNFDKWSVDKNSLDGVKPFSEGYARGIIDNQWCFVNSEMRINDIRVEWIGAYSEGMAGFSDNGKYGFFDTDFDIVIEADYDGVATNDFEQCFNSGRAFVKDDEGYIMIDEKGEQVGNQTFEEACAFLSSGSLAAVKQDGKWGFVNTDGEIIIKCQFSNAKSFSENGLAAVSDGDKWGFINADGNVVIDYIYKDVRPFVGITAQVCYQDGWMLISLLDSGY